MGPDFVVVFFPKKTVGLDTKPHYERHNSCFFNLKFKVKILSHTCLGIVSCNDPKQKLGPSSCVMRKFCNTFLYFLHRLLAYRSVTLFETIFVILQIKVFSQESLKLYSLASLPQISHSLLYTLLLYTLLVLFWAEPFSCLFNNWLIEGDNGPVLALGTRIGNKRLKGENDTT
jgi:hypothetical protein